MQDVELQTNPKHSGNQKIGECMTVLRKGLIGEDAAIFNQTLPYSIKTKEKSSLLRCKIEHASKWPEDIQKNLKIHSFDKYKIFFSQLQTKQKKLTTPANQYILKMEKMM